MLSIAPSFFFGLKIVTFRNNGLKAQYCYKKNRKNEKKIKREKTKRDGKPSPQPFVYYILFPSIRAWSNFMFYTFMDAFIFLMSSMALPV
jgi:hypothetical protein